MGAKMFVGILLAGTMLVFPALAIPASAAEQPYNRVCDDATGAVACAGADAGANADCSLDPRTGIATCDWSFGWNLEATSDAGLPGEGTLTWSYAVEVCRESQPCSATTDSGTASCTWLPAGACTDTFTDQETFEVSLGANECITVHVATTGSASASVPSADGSLASATTADASEHAATVCHYIQGR